MKVFDYEKAMAATDGDIDLLKELINLFKQQSPRLLAEIQQAVEAGRPDELALAAHTLKGSVANLGGMAMYEVALALETMGVKNDLVAAHKAFRKLTAEVKKFEQETAKLDKIPA